MMGNTRWIGMLSASTGSDDLDARLADTWREDSSLGMRWILTLWLDSCLTTLSGLSLDAGLTLDIAALRCTADQPSQTPDAT